MNFAEYQRLVKDGQTLPADAGAVPREARGYQGQAAGLVTRVIAVCLDVALVYALMRVLEIGLRAVDAIATPLFTIPIPSPQAFAAIGLITLWAYATWAWAALGRTFGEHVMGLKVLDQHGSRLGVKRAAVRSAACLAFPIGLLWVLVSRENSSLQDIVLRTSVVYRWVI